jgi:hypothetical protein
VAVEADGVRKASVVSEKSGALEDTRGLGGYAGP